MPTPTQLRGPFTMMELDGAETPASVVQSLHRLGKRAVCYVDVGTWEAWRPDASAFPKSLLGASDIGWSGERWLDIRQLKQLMPIMKARFESCVRKGFDAVDPDNVDGVSNRTGFALTMKSQLTYDRAIASLAHGLHLVVALKSFASEARELQPQFDFAVDEQCVQYRECGAFTPFLARHKAVFDIEYTATLSFCPSFPVACTGYKSISHWMRG